MSTARIWHEGPYGILPGENIDVYHRNAAISKSKLDVFLESETLFFRTYIAQNLVEKKDDDDDSKKRWRIFGNAAHARLLEGEAAYIERYCVEPNFGDCRKTDRTTTEEGKVNKARRDEWRMENIGKTFLSDYESRCMDALTVAARSVPVVRELLLRVKPELVFRVKGDELDLQCRCDGFIESTDQALCDLLNAGDGFAEDPCQVGDAVVADLKTVDSFSSADFTNWNKQVWNLGYHRAAAFYRGVMRSVKPFPRLHWVFIAVEKSEPFRAGVYRLDERSMAKGWDEIKLGLDRLKWCVRESTWRGLPQTVQTLSLPEWYIKKEIPISPVG